jgi:hypothetical protein
MLLTIFDYLLTSVDNFGGKLKLKRKKPKSTKSCSPVLNLRSTGTQTMKKVLALLAKAQMWILIEGAKVSFFQRTKLNDRVPIIFRG